MNLAIVFVLLWCSDVGNRITELNKVVGRLHTEMKDLHQKLQWRRKSEPDQANILGKYIMGARNNFRDFDRNEAMGCENTSLHISTQLTEEEDEEEKKGEIISEREEPESEGPVEPVPGEETAFETAGTPDVWETNTALRFPGKISSEKFLDTFKTLHITDQIWQTVVRFNM